MYSLSNTQKQIETKYREIAVLRKEQVAIAKSEGLKEVPNYIFRDAMGNEVSLAALFENHDELILIHNMGKSCPHCTLWADGLSSAAQHIQNRCAFALSSPDDYLTLAEFASGRDWRFPFVSAHDSNFAEDMGFSHVNVNGKKVFTPGYSTFLKKEGKIYRVAFDLFGPGDFYSPIWHMMDLLYHSDREWHPKFSY